MTTEIQAYMDANPQIRDEIQAVRQPAADSVTRCEAPLPPVRADGLAVENAGGASVVTPTFGSYRHN